MSYDHFHCNGIDAESGAYLLPELTPAELAKLARGEPLDEESTRELAARHAAGAAHFGVPDGFDPNDLGDTGWGVIFTTDCDPAVRAALAPLIEHRRTEAAAKKESRFRVFEGVKGYRPGLRKTTFLFENGAAPAEPDPDKIPYYLLLVGSPESIPFDFQYQLDVQYSVGRIHFDTPEGYANYVRTVLAAEQGGVARAKRFALFGPRNHDDDATALSADVLLDDLQKNVTAPDGWTSAATVGEGATKARLATLLGGAETPALLFTASHGIGFPKGHAKQVRHQGALLTQDWGGPVEHRGPIKEAQYFSADDLAADADVAGLVAFCFACYGAGTPRRDAFTRAQGQAIGEIAAAPFVSSLARALLGHPKGGALAFVGHVERAWGYSFYWPEAGAATRSFRDALKRMLFGHRVGYAVEPFNDKHAALSADLTATLEAIREGLAADDAELARMWTANNDARNYAIVGDPAVRIAVQP